MSMRSRVLVLCSTMLIGQAACDDETTSPRVDVAVGPIEDAGVFLDTQSGMFGMGEGGMTDVDGAATDVAMADVAMADAAMADAGIPDAPLADGAVDGAGDARPVPTFTQIYNTIITQRCMPCHTTPTGPGSVMGALDMSSRAIALMNLVNVAASGSACAGNGLRVVGGASEISLLYLKVSREEPTPCGGKMPLGRDPLPVEEAEMIRDWIEDGAKDN